MVEVGVFRVEGKPMLTLLNYAAEGWIPEETEAAHGLLMLLNFNDEQGRKNRVQKSLSK